MKVDGRRIILNRSLITSARLLSNICMTLSAISEKRIRVVAFGYTYIPPALHGGIPIASRAIMVKPPAEVFDFWSTYRRTNDINLLLKAKNEIGQGAGNCRICRIVET